MYFPSAGIEINPILLLSIGITVGVCSGFFGFGGGFMMTPALNMFGLPMPFAIGTDLTQMAGSSAISTMKHRKLGHVDFRLGILMVVGTVTGVEVGKHLIMYMEDIGNVDLVVRYIYIVLLVGLGLYMFKEARKSAANRSIAPSPEDTTQTAPSPLVQKLRALNIPPFVSLPVSGISRISIWIPLGIGFVTGVLAGLLGVGGGFIRMPALVYLLGVPTVIAVGTDLFEIVISGAYGCFTYAMVGRVEIMAAIIILIGSSAGVQIGATATRYVRGTSIRSYFAITIILAGVSVALKQVAHLMNLAWLGTTAIYMLLGVAGCMAMLITVMFVRAKSFAKKDDLDIRHIEQAIRQ
ncbi:sulfite exporter TauE/SafE family protein [Chloroflexota bacterium]